MAWGFAGFPLRMVAHGAAHSGDDDGDSRVARRCLKRCLVGHNNDGVAQSTAVGEARW
jgi:hypothetical protein